VSDGGPGRRRLAAITAGFLLCIFAFGTAEFLVSGLLPQVAAGLSVSPATAGQAVTAYALATVVGGPILTAVTARVPRKGLTVGLLVAFLLGTALSAAATGYATFLTGRILAGLAQATFFALSLVVVTRAVAPDRAGRAVSWITSGFTVSILLGVPLGTLVGQRFGWRTPFVVITVVAVVGAGLLMAAVPREKAPTTGAGDELRALVRLPVLLAIATTAVGLAGVGTVYTYVVALMTLVTGFTAPAVSGLLFAYGAGSVVGNLMAGRLSDRYPRWTLPAILCGLVILLALIPLAVTAKTTAAAAILALGLLATATITPLQALILRRARAAPTLSVAVNVAAFNLANALGAAIGGAVLAAGWLRFSGFVGAVLAAGGLALAWSAQLADRVEPDRGAVHRGGSTLVDVRPVPGRLEFPDRGKGTR
jgi:DHA1 family inner membrane transport protein